MSVTIRYITADHKFVSRSDDPTTTIPVDEANSDWMKILSEGLTPLPYEDPAPTGDDVAAERDRRLASGFVYDFADGRGIHLFGTTKSDLEGWQEVRILAALRRETGDATPIQVSTETGMVEISPNEWLSVDKAASDFRQPIWAASFALTLMDPIPSDFFEDKWWPAAQ